MDYYDRQDGAVKPGDRSRDPQEDPAFSRDLNLSMPDYVRIISKKIEKKKS